MRKNIIIAVLALNVFTINAQEQPVGDGIFYGPVKISEENLDKTDMYYWSVGAEINGRGSIREARQVFSSGVAQADFRLCTYEDGSPIFENGKYFLCASSRSTPLGQSIYSYDINTCNMTLVGVVQGLTEDGGFRNLIAQHIIYNRKDGWWYIFAHWWNPHHLCGGRSLRDLRFGYSQIACHQLDYEAPAKGDEDNFIFFDSEIGKWTLIYSKGSTLIAKQTSDCIDGGYKMEKFRDDVSTLTGVSAVMIGGRRYIVSGFGRQVTDGSPHIDGYKVFDAETLADVCDLNIDIPTGGWRGWGTIMDIPEGDGTKYQLLTFDRINPTERSNWEYGNTYLYEAVERNTGYEYDLVRPEGPVIKASAGSELAPSDLHFIRKFTQRLDYCQEILMSRLDLSGNIFLPKGNPYPIRKVSDGISYSCTGGKVELNGIGTFSLLVGGHVPNCEYVIDLSGMERGERRFLSISTLDKDVCTITFFRKGGLIHICTDPSSSGRSEEVLSIASETDYLRIQVEGNSACFVTK